MREPNPVQARCRPNIAREGRRVGLRPLKDKSQCQKPEAKGSIPVASTGPRARLGSDLSYRDVWGALAHLSARAAVSHDSGEGRQRYGAAPSPVAARPATRWIDCEWHRPLRNVLRTSRSVWSRTLRSACIRARGRACMPRPAIWWRAYRRCLPPALLLESPLDSAGTASVATGSARVGGYAPPRGRPVVSLTHGHERRVDCGANSQKT